MTAGTVVEAKTRPAITREQLRAYANASGDPNEIHLDDEVAKKFGLPGIIAHGMLVAAFVSERAEDFARETAPGLALAGLQTRFKAMTLLGDTLSIGGKVKDAGDGKLVLDLQAVNQRGETVVQATVRFGS